MGWHAFFPLAGDVARALDLFLHAIAVALVPLVLVRRKPPAATVAWILLLVFMPVIGSLLFLGLGRDRVRLPAKRKKEIDAQVRAQVAASRSEPPLSDGRLLLPIDTLERGLFRIGQNLTHTRATSGNAVRLLDEGGATYQAMGDAIDAAKDHVHAQFYLIRNDATGAWFRDRLTAAAARGVEVRLLMDGYGCFTLPSSWARPLTKAGGHVARFSPLRSLIVQPINLRNHRKIIVVDGTTAFTGGFNIGDEYKGGNMPGVGTWRDVHLRIDGPAAAELQRVFFQDWAYATGRPIDPAGYFPSPIPEHGNAKIAVVPSGPDTHTEAIHRLFFGAIVGAGSEVLVTTPYFVPDEALLVAMELAAMRGVKVRMILPGHSNHAATFHAGRSFYSDLLRAGVEIFEFVPGIVHAKTMIVDSLITLVGSANMDLRSFRLNYEIHTLMHDPGTARRLGETFARDLEKSRRVDFAEWEARSWLLKVKEGAARLVSPLL
jgi:cardiolipin synthase